MAVIRIHNVDLNTIIETKILWASRDYESQYNFPDDAVNGFLQVIEYGGIIKQIYWRHGTANTTSDYFYTRSKFEIGWSDWVKFAGTLL